MVDRACVNVDFNDLETIIEKLHELEALDVERDRIMRIYPAIVRVLIGKMELAVNKVQVKEIFEDMVSKEITNLKGFSSNN